MLHIIVSLLESMAFSRDFTKNLTPCTVPVAFSRALKTEKLNTPGVVDTNDWCIIVCGKKACFFMRRLILIAEKQLNHLLIKFHFGKLVYD